MRHHRAARAVVDGGDAHLGEPGDVGPAQLGSRLAADRVHERGRDGPVETGPRRGCAVGDLDLVAVEEVAQERGRLLDAAVGGESVVHADADLVGDHVARDATGDAHGVQALVVLEPVHLGLPRLVLAQPLQDFGGLVDGVVAHPGPGAVCPHAARHHVDPHGALAAALDDGGGGLHQHREVGLEPLRPRAGDPLQPVALELDLLALVQEQRQVAVRLGQLGGRTQDHRAAALHVTGPQAQQPVAVQPSGEVVVHRHRVEVAGECHALLASEVGTGHHGVAVAFDVQVRQLAQGGLHRVGDRPLVAADRVYVHQRVGERDDVLPEV